MPVIMIQDNNECVRMAKLSGFYFRMLAEIRASVEPTGANVSVKREDDGFIAFVKFWGYPELVHNSWLMYKGVNLSEQQIDREVARIHNQIDEIVKNSSAQALNCVI